jgi:hypothetical protein
VHETEAAIDAGSARLRRVEHPGQLPDAIADIALNAGCMPSAA